MFPFISWFAMSISAISCSPCMYTWLCCFLDLFLCVLWFIAVKHSERGRNPLKIDLWCLHPSLSLFPHHLKGITHWYCDVLFSVGPICMNSYALIFWMYWNSWFWLQVWDGTKCPYPTWKVPVEAKELEGDRVLLHHLRNLTVDVLVYDNHVQLAKSLKVMYNSLFLVLNLWSIFCLELTSENVSMQFCS